METEPEKVAAVLHPPDGEAWAEDPEMEPHAAVEDAEAGARGVVAAGTVVDADVPTHADLGID